MTSMGNMTICHVTHTPCSHRAYLLMRRVHPSSIISSDATFYLNHKEEQKLYSLNPTGIKLNNQIIIQLYHPTQTFVNST